jgi:hypothetical protein
MEEIIWGITLAHNNIREMALFEHRFWLQILGDHSRFILNAFSPEETHFINQANEFIGLFDALLEKARKPVSDEKLNELNHQAYSAAMKIRKLKLTILSKKLKEQIKFNISSSFINLMINEVEEYICIIEHLAKGHIVPIRDINLHLFWLEDGIGHAEAVANALDSTQKELIKKNREYQKKFTDFYLTAIGYNGYSRTGICEFPALRKFNFDIDDIMGCFKKSLEDLKEKLLEKEVLGIITPLMADHMFREECYYLTKLSMVSDTEPPGCNPARPRLET